MNIPKGVGIALGILVIITIILIFNNNEGFTVVEEDVDKIITIQDGSLLSKINKKEEVVKNIWGCSDFGKEIKLC
jgi:hypothetical protein